MGDGGLNRKDAGIVAGLIMAVQLVTSLYNGHIMAEMAEMKVEREQYFVRKEVVAQIHVKLDAMSEQISEVKQQVAALKAVMQAELDESEYDPVVVWRK